ncbi:MAG TPA: 3-hydroxyacyl-CoA dehydrogenase NAD-binding domain-containing protein [Thermodesulfovibrionales bacterium]|nr:3-hydroxyacyl-CoA dehydrogenase NAD-binding domain-containing protein [Thermodesulfovibrionales bacterium]
MGVRRIAVIGAGTMGGGISEVAARSGYEVVLKDMSEEYVGAGLARIRGRLDKRVAERKIGAEERERILANIRTTTDLKECAEADLVIEAVIEQEETKREIFQELDVLCPEDTIFSTNTSAISITRLGGATKRPGRFIGMHFMNPAYIMKLVEVVRGLRTSEETVKTIIGVSEKMGKTAVVVKDFPAFISSRLIMHVVNEAIFALQEEVASRDSIDTIMKLGAHHPMGPLELADLMGLDICLATLELLHAELGEKYRPCVLLRQMVAAGKLGRKSREGFYEYQ